MGGTRNYIGGVDTVGTLQIYLNGIFSRLRSSRFSAVT